jgi:hypothetical protein
LGYANHHAVDVSKMTFLNIVCCGGFSVDEQASPAFLLNEVLHPRRTR